jgi:hypothetical protein
MARIDRLANILWRMARFDLCSCHDETGDVTEYDDARAAAFERTANYAERSKLWDVEYVTLDVHRNEICPVASSSLVGSSGSSISA